MAAERALRFYLVRHGITAWNREMRMQGHTDIPLDAEGREQAVRTAARIALLPEPPVAIWSSDLRRAHHTAESIAAPLRLTVHTTPLLRETLLGEWEGLTRADIEARGDADQLARYVMEPHLHRPPGGETLEAAWKRMTQATAQIRAEVESGSVVIVGHGGSLRALVCEALEAPVSSMRRVWFDNCSLSRLDELITPNGILRRVMLLNDTSHLTGK